MRQLLITLGIVIGTLVALCLYCAALIEWVQDYRTGVYGKEPLEALLETGAILGYSYGGYKFLKWRVTL